MLDVLYYSNNDYLNKALKKIFFDFLIWKEVKEGKKRRGMVESLKWFLEEKVKNGMKSKELDEFGGWKRKDDNE